MRGALTMARLHEAVKEVGMNVLMPTATGENNDSRVKTDWEGLLIYAGFSGYHYSSSRVRVAHQDIIFTTLQFRYEADVLRIQ